MPLTTTGSERSIAKRRLYLWRAQPLYCDESSTLPRKIQLSESVCTESPPLIFHHTIHGITWLVSHRLLSSHHAVARHSCSLTCDLSGSGDPTTTPGPQLLHHEYDSHDAQPTYTQITLLRSSPRSLNLITVLHSTSVTHPIHLLPTNPP